MTVLARYRCGQPEHIFRLGRAGNRLKANCGQMVAFVHHHMSIVGNEVGDLAFPHQALDGCNVDETCRLFLSTTDNSNLSIINIKECAEPRYPLIQKLLAVHRSAC